MAGMAYQSAPQPKKTGAAPKKTAEHPQKNLMQRLHDLPQAAGIAFLALLLILSLFVGNFRALQNAAPKDFIRQGDVKSIVEDRLDAAANAQTVASRAEIDSAITDAVANAIHAMENAKTAREISRADQALTAAVSRLVTEADDQLDSESRQMLSRAADDFAEQGSFLRQEARAYNKEAEKAEALYEKLPTKFLLSEPDMYEGI